jgi:hypothetical protein
VFLPSWHLAVAVEPVAVVVRLVLEQVAAEVGLLHNIVLLNWR